MYAAVNRKCYVDIGIDKAHSTENYLTQSKNVF